MHEPFKIIYKVKNDNGKAQYYIYIYLGVTPPNIMKILNKMKDYTIYETLMTLSLTNLHDLEHYYGKKWYTFFFNKFHITQTFYGILNNKQTLKELEDRLGSEFIDNNIRNIQIAKKRVEQYGSIIKRKLLHHEMRTHRNFEYIESPQQQYNLVHENTQSQYYTPQKYSGVKSGILLQLRNTNNNEQLDESSDKNVKSDEKETSSEISINSLENIGEQHLTQSGGDEEDEQQTDDTDNNEESDIDQLDDVQETEEELSGTTPEQTDEDLEKLYIETEQITRKDNSKTNELLKKMFDDDNIMKKKEHNMIPFDTSKDTNIYKENISEVYKKNYITDQYIFKDDTIRTIKNKICCSIKSHPKFGNNHFIIPSRQYLWSEYLSGDYYEKIMIGTKWTQRNELLKIDIEPNDNIKIYESLRDTIKNLHDDLKRFNSKIKKEDEENNILIDYSGYYENNELYLIDIYNELGKGYHAAPESVTNLTDTYVKIYFPKIPQNEIKQIIEYLNETSKIEQEKIELTYETIRNDLILENEVVNIIEKAKEERKYKNIMKEQYITQSMIHLMLRSDDTNQFKRINLFKIFDDFIPSETYPFIQYMTPDGNVTYKLNEEETEKYTQNKGMLPLVASWFQNVSYGLSFRIKTSNFVGDNERFLAVNLSDLGKIDYKIQWKIIDNAVIGDIDKTHDVINKLVEEINKTSLKHKFDIPVADDFHTAFITAIQKFEFDGDFKINHNDLSRFARFFYPYFALVIEPRKRISKIHEDEQKSKFGTYLRYKRISKYENPMKIEQRIIYFIRNYEYSEQTIINEISKQFNITLDNAEEQLRKTIQKWPKLRKARRDLKKFDMALKYRSPGIDVSIQGKLQDKYKVRISGARDSEQLDRIVSSLNALFYLYMETYLIKNPDFQYIKDKLKTLTNIAERRHTVNDFVKYSESKAIIKNMASADKRRIGYKPEKGQSHYTRVCQNSGDTQRRRPQQYMDIEELQKLGYSYNKSSGTYERKVILKKNGKTTTQTIRAVKLNDLDEITGQPTGNEIYYTCSPEKNGSHMYIGFLTKSKNPLGEFMPCCFKKDQASSSNSEKRDFFLSCIGKSTSNVNKQQTPTFNEQLYILQDTNKIQPNRFGFLPKILDYYMNEMIGNTKTYIQHYLVSAPTGYFFKFGIDHKNNSFLSAIANVFDLELINLVGKIINIIENDKNDLIFTSLNNGEIKTVFGSREKYIAYLKKIDNIEFENVYHLLTLPNVLAEFGTNIIIIYRSPTETTDTKIKDNCYFICTNGEEITNLEDPKRETILLYSEHDVYYPIYSVNKVSPASKTLDSITRTYSYENNKSNILEHIKDFYYSSCMERTIKSLVDKDINLTAKHLCNELRNLNKSEFLPKYQFVDTQNKCRYIITSNGIMIPVSISGSIYNIPIIKKVDNYIMSFGQTMDKINSLLDILSIELPIKPIIAHYDTEENNKINVKAIVLNNGETLPVIQEFIDSKLVSKYHLTAEVAPSYDKINSMLYNPEKYNVVDERVSNTNYNKYINESYELFRFVLSEYINQESTKNIKNKLLKIINSSYDDNDKINNIKTIFYKLIDDELLQLHLKLLNKNDTETHDLIDDIGSEPQIAQTGGTVKKFVQIIETIPNIDKYNVMNIRENCLTLDKNKCSKNPHCGWIHSSCFLTITKRDAINFVNKISTEFVEQPMKMKEIMQLDDHYVSDVVNKNYYTERANQKIIKTTQENVKRTMDIFFGDEKLKNIKIKQVDKQNTETDKLVLDNPMRDFGKKYIQTIIPSNNSILRAYANGYHWIENQFQDKSHRNIGYYSREQTDIMIYLKSLIINWMLDAKNEASAKQLLNDNMNGISDREYVIKLVSAVSDSISGDVELFVLNQLQKIPIVIYSDDVVKKVFDGKIITSSFEKYENNKNTINLQFEYITSKIIPSIVEVVYFK